MKIKNVSSYIITFPLLFLLSTLYAKEKTPDLDTLTKEPTPTQKPIEEQTLVEGAEETYAVESEKRSRYIYPSNYGQAGLFRTRSAESLPDGALSFGIGGEFYSVGNAPYFNGSSNAKTIAESLFIGYSPTKQFTLSVMRRNSSTTFGTPQQLISSLGDFNFSFLYSFPINESFVIAPIVDVLIASNFNNLAPAGTTLSAGFGGAATYSLFPNTGLPLYFHANAFFHMPQIHTSKTGPLEPETYFGFSRFHTLTLALGAEYQIGDFIPFIEFFDKVQINSGIPFGKSPSKLSLGSRITPLENKSLAFLLGMDIGMGKGLVAGVPFTPDYQIIGQLSYTFGLNTTERKHYYTTQDVNVVDRKLIIKKIIRFKVGRAELEPESAHLLDQIADVIKVNKVKKMLIAGHTDSTHSEDYNLKLSIDRSNAVKRYMVNKGIAEESLTTQGFGKRKPRASNATEVGRMENRRVEFFILE